MSSAVRTRVTAGWAFAIVASGAASIVLVLSPRAAALPIRWSTTIGLAGLIVLMTVLAILLLVRRPGHRIGRVFATLTTILAVSFFCETYVRVSYATGQPPLPGALVFGWVNLWGPGGLWLMVALLLLWFPDGRLPSPRWRVVLWGAVAVYGTMMVAGMFGGGRLGEVGPVNPLHSPAADRLFGGIGDSVWLASTLVVVASAASLITRYRAAADVERRQLKWLMLSGILVVSGGAVMLVGSLMVPGGNDDIATVAGALFGAGLVSVPVFATLAILRYRLYDIERIVSRTLAYAVLTGVLGALYAVAVFAISSVVASVGGESEVAVAGATLAVAGAFRPVRSRVQHAVNRRFNRARYDAEHTVQGFAERLRDRMDVDDVGADLLQTTIGVVQPLRAQLWLRPET